MKFIFSRWNFNIKAPVLIRCSLCNYTISTIQYQVYIRNDHTSRIENPAMEVCDMDHRLTNTIDDSALSEGNRTPQPCQNNQDWE